MHAKDLTLSATPKLGARQYLQVVAISLFVCVRLFACAISLILELDDPSAGLLGIASSILRTFTAVLVRSRVALVGHSADAIPVLDGEN
ncbi:hypothetical protein AF336_11180 [Bradyrhizobium diazoefficiens]|nr:hypothetical protein BD122_31830 [Bradyrhizobium diazoefficiens]KOY09951.1 hypothetical protein AF336_11180 [Bradyrhizobium diazoefficiens]